MEDLEDMRLFKEASVNLEWFSDSTQTTAGQLSLSTNIRSMTGNS